MTPEQVELVQSSFKKVEPIATEAGDLFYGRLFEIAPQVRPMFSDDIATQRDKLMKMLSTAVTNLHQVELIIPAVEDLGRRHVDYGVVDEHYDTVGSALLWTLEQGLKDDFTPEVKEAWTETYTTLAGVMKAAAAEAPPKKKGLLSSLFGR
ncbi:MAG: hemoglobin [Rhodomicrobium sp.]|nr:MAG: hemoglobin [Rhodomicrobium sp.]